MQVDHETAARFRGEAALRSRVNAFRAALAAHRLTVNVPKPVEHELVERLAHLDSFTVEAAPVVPAPPAQPAVPPFVTVRQARLALHGAGLLPAVQAWVDQGPEEVRITWEYAMIIERASPLIAQAEAALGMSSQQMDALFVAAATL